MNSHHPDIHQRITDQIIGMLEGGAGEFQLPWHRPAASFWRPINVVSKKRYNGVNVLALWAAAQERGFLSGLWATYRQWAAIGAQVRKGETAAFVVIYRERSASSERSNDDEQREGQLRFFAKATAVFAAEQVDGYRAEQPPVVDPGAVIAEAEKFVAATGATIHYEGHRAFYRTSTDSIHLPPREKFVGTGTISPTESFYATVLHELIHWSGCEHRCNRQLGQRFELEAYAVEELIAELGAAFLCADLGVLSAPRPDHASYLASWLQILKSDKRAIFTAASKASQAVAFLENLQPSE
jgi:antirestriction protein ArdC